jgi:hypothetical protein
MCCKLLFLLDLKSLDFGRAGSSPAPGTKSKQAKTLFLGSPQRAPKNQLPD